MRYESKTLSLYRRLAENPSKLDHEIQQCDRSSRATLLILALMVIIRVVVVLQSQPERGFSRDHEPNLLDLAVMLAVAGMILAYLEKRMRLHAMMAVLACAEARDGGADGARRSAGD